MSQIENIEITLNMSHIVTVNNDAKFRGYALGYNVLKIVNGISGLVFTR